MTQQQEVQVNANDPKMEIKIQNYKQFTEFEQSVGDFNIVIFTGDNEAGKTSLLTALKEAHAAKSMTGEPLKRGEQSGKNTIKTQDKDGNEVTVIQSIESDSTKFVCFQDDGTPVRKITKIRELLGEYLDITVQDFFNKAQTKPGQQEIITKYLYKCLTPDQQKRIQEIDDKISKSGGTLYDERTRIGNSLKEWKGSKETLKLSDEEEKIIQNLDKAKERKESLQKELNGIESEKNKKQQLQAEIDNLEALKKRIANFDETKDITQDIENTKSKLSDIISSIDVSQERIDELNDKLKKAEEYIENIQETKTKKSKWEDAIKNCEQKEKEYKDVNKQIEDLREERMKIFQNSSLPESISIDEDGFKLDGFDFAETQVSYSKAALAITELLASISDNKLIAMGDASEFNSERLKKLCEISEKHGKFVAMTRVIEGEDVKAVGIMK